MNQSNHGTTSIPGPPSVWSHGVLMGESPRIRNCLIARIARSWNHRRFMWRSILSWAACANGPASGVRGVTVTFGGSTPRRGSTVSVIQNTRGTVSFAHPNSPLSSSFNPPPVSIELNRRYRR